jgi:hypothetical protein
MRAQPAVAPSFMIPPGVGMRGAMLKLERLGLVRRSTHGNMWALTKEP